MTVKQKQNLLDFPGYYEGEVDGIWGEKSRRALEDFQKERGLTVGNFTEETANALLKAVGDWEKEEPERESSGTFWDEITFFEREEFRCTCGGRGCTGFPAEPAEQLVSNAEAARIHFGAAADVSSGVRCRLRNGELPGSAANSLHLRGKAMDFRVRGISARTLCDYVKTLPRVDEAYAIDDQFVHMGVEKD